MERGTYAAAAAAASPVNSPFTSCFIGQLALTLQLGLSGPKYYIMMAQTLWISHDWFPAPAAQLIDRNLLLC